MDDREYLESITCDVCGETDEDIMHCAWCGLQICHICNCVWKRDGELYCSECIKNKGEMPKMKCRCKSKGTKNQCKWCGEHTIDWNAVDFQKALNAGCRLKDLPKDETVHGEADETCVGCAHLGSEEE